MSKQASRARGATTGRACLFGTAGPLVIGNPREKVSALLPCYLCTPLGRLVTMQKLGLMFDCERLTCSLIRLTPGACPISSQLSVLVGEVQCWRGEMWYGNRH